MLPNFLQTESSNFFLMAGPCVIEDEQMPFDLCAQIDTLCRRLDIPFIFKASYRKANRSKLDSFTGIGDQKSLELLRAVGQKYHCPTVTDIHSAEEAANAAPYVDVLQIPAFLCRQTDLLLAAGQTGRCVNIKKGQFVAPDSMQFAVEKIRSTGNHDVMLTERGTSFGYQDLVIDFRSIPLMQRNKVPVVVDITHSLQQPNQSSGITGGQPEMIESIAKAAIAVGCDGIFLETHPNPQMAKSDGANMLRLDLLENLLVKLVKIRQSL